MHSHSEWRSVLTTQRGEIKRKVEGKVAVVRAEAASGLVPGEVITAIGDQPVEACLAAAVKRACNSTDRGRLREACGRLLAGAPGTTVAVSVQGADEAVRRVTLKRERASSFGQEPNVSSRDLGQSIGYVRISGWGGAGLVEKFDRALEDFKSCRGLVIDVRGNGGGSDQLADLVNGRLTAKAVVSSIDLWRQAGTDQYKKTLGWVQPRGPWTFAGRVAVLIDEGCASACEHFVSGVEAMGRVLLVGLPTNGAGGGPTLVNLPDGTRVRISRALGLRANGVVFEGHGIPPHLYATPTLEDLRQGRDHALTLAQEWIISGKDLPARSQPLPW